MQASLATTNFIELDLSQDFLSDRTSAELEEKNRYLRFPLGSSEYLLPLDSLQEIFRVSPATIVPVPEVPRAIWGIYNWRGGLAWMLDLEELLTGQSGLNPQRDRVLCLLFPLKGQYLGLLITQIDLQGLQGGPRIESFDRHELLPLSPTMTDNIPTHFFAGYFLDADNVSLQLLNPQAILEAFTQG